MHYIKRIITVLVLFVFITLIVSLFLSSELTIKKIVLINADKSLIQQTVFNFDYGKLADYKIESKNEIWEFNELKDQIDLVSIVRIDLGFNPISKFHGIFDKDKIGDIVEMKLDSLKAVLENSPKIHQVRVKKVFNEKDVFFLSIRDTVNQFEINNIHGKLYTEINQFMDNNEVKSDEAPIVIYHFWSDTLIDIEAGIPIEDSAIVVNGRIKMNKIKSGYSVTATHYGEYERLPETYFGINEWMRKHKVIVTGVPWEIYVTDPSTESNPANWETAIYFPVKE